ncbi:Lar family restriction alleviation protein [Candidatus Pacearchaeota archaeon]|nr:Lar family restriction alleviation protein [Candidatus Pacearchaeota archaeon]
MTNLSPCPFCIDSDDDLRLEDHNGQFQVICWTCGAGGPVIANQTKEEAIAAWNKRAADLMISTLRKAHTECAAWILNSEGYIDNEDPIWEYLAAVPE